MQNYPGKIKWDDEGETAYIWTDAGWTATIRVTRGDMKASEFRDLVRSLLAKAKNGVSQ